MFMKSSTVPITNIFNVVIAAFCIIPCMVHFPPLYYAGIVELDLLTAI